jgi:hypothetical protein
MKAINTKAGSFGSKKVILEGQVSKKSTLFYRERVLILFEENREPRLEYWLKNKAKLRGTIPLHKGITAKLVDSKRFEISGGPEVLYFKDSQKVSCE